ncbi:VanZ family protein [Clostridium botulinum]|nr:VanZ family protein [Clostridium botulinum]
MFTQSRTTTTDDLIMNTLGAIIGYFIFKAFFHIILKKIATKKMK